MRSSRLLRLLLFLSVCALLLMRGPGNKAVYGSEWCSGYVCQEWAARYDGGAGLSPLLAASDSGNVYVAGSSSNDDYLLVKYDASGNQQWVRTYNGGGSDVPTAIALDASENVYVTGSSSSGAGWDYATVKYDSDGNQKWVERYHGPGQGHDSALALAVDPSGEDVYVTGRSYSSTTADYATIAYDADGNQRWEARYDNGDFDSADAIAIDGEGDVYVTGFSIGSDGTYATIKYDSAGNQLWAMRHSGWGSGAIALSLDGSGYVYVTGVDFMTIKYSPNGDEVWTATRTDAFTGSDNAYAATVDSSGNAYVAGGTVGVGTDTDFTTLKFNTDGSEAWVASYNDIWNGQDYARAIAMDSAGNVYVTGYSQGFSNVATGGADYATIKYDANGNEVWVARYDDPAGHHDFATALGVIASGDVYVTGFSDNDYATVKYSQTSPPWPTFTPLPTYTPTPTATPTSTPTATKTPGGIGPDLMVEDMYSAQTMENYCNTPAGLIVVVKNDGTSAAGISTTAVTGGMDGYPVYLYTPALGPGQSVALFAYKGSGTLTAMADYDNIVHESDESNNSLTKDVYLITLPTCTATPPVTPTATATPIPVGTPDPAGVGGIAEPPEDFGGTHGGGGLPIGAIAMLAGVAVVAGSAGGWYARRRFGRQRR